MSLFLDVLLQQGLDAYLDSEGKEIRLKCPLCEDTQARLYVNKKTGAFICFRCDKSGSPYTLLREVLGLDHFETLRLLAKVDRQPEHPVAHYHREAKADVPVKAGIDLPAEYHRLTHPDDIGQGVFWRYLKSRGLTEKDVNEYEIGFCLRGPYAFRVIIPVKSNGILWTFVARAVTPLQPKKVLHPPGAQPSRALFGIDHLSRKGFVIIVEGVFDAIRLQHTAVATLGTNFSGHQRQLLHNHGIRHVFLLWDGDVAGRHGAALVAGRLVSSGFEVGVALLPEGKDPADASDAEIARALNNPHVPPPYVSHRLLAKRLDFLAAAL